ncbi:zinc finger CCCH domain-containing protein 30-like isoform X1 [Glycine soja]|nr:zinc finger CCCH domain-containing protein 30-like isoform X1 [Glycine soja]
MRCHQNYKRLTFLFANPIDSTSIVNLSVFTLIRFDMKRARKSNRVSWATGDNLCQVKLFLSEDFPSIVGQKSQDHLQAKTSSMLHSSINEPNDLPPGFESSHFLNQPKVEFSNIPQIKWECPPVVVVRSQWRVAAGEESREKENQKLREMRVLEALYPRLSAIPPSPSVSLDVEEEDYDDGRTPLIPIIPIEEEESTDILPELAVALKPSPNVQSQNSQQYISAKTSISSASNAAHAVSLDPCIRPMAGVSSGMEADLAAASSVVATIIRSNEQGTLIDMDLLGKIFTDPKILEQLINEHGTAATTASASSNTVDIPTSGLKPAIPSVLVSTPTPDVTASWTTPTSAVGSLPSGFGLKPSNPSVSLLNPTPTLSVPAIPSVSLLSSSHDKPVTASVPLSRPVPGMPVTPSVSMLTHHTPAPDMHRPVSKNFHHVSSGMPPALNNQSQQETAMASGPKRANYYKNLIRQHGADKQDIQDSHIGIRHSNFQDMKPVHNIKQREVKPKILKPCIYFKSPRGCRNGSNCSYQHDVSAQEGAGNVLRAQSAKRLKLGGEN